MSKTTGRIDREGVIRFHDASISIWEEGLTPRMTAKERDSWELEFKRQVFARVVQTLNRLGWTVGPWDQTKQYKCIALNYRTCRKGDLHAELSVNGRCIEFQMWQDVTPSENPNGGRYDFDKLKRMPYVLRLEVERTRRRVLADLCAAHGGYTVKQPDPVLGLVGVTATEKAKHRRMTTGHYKPALDRAEFGMDCNQRARDGGLIGHGSKVWATDRKGRVITGTAYYSLNSGWDIVSGRYDMHYVHTGSIYTQVPEVLRDRWGRLRLKDNARERRKRLELELQKAIADMNFKRAEVLKGILFPVGPLYAIYSKKWGSYFDVMYCGYRSSLADAGKYTRDELKPYLGKALETDQFKAVPVAAA